jgi:transglutaminase-like putative cysteine protease
VELGDIDLIRMDETVLVRLEPFGFKKRLPEHLSIKIRGAVFDVYEENTWKQSITPRWRRLKNEGSLTRLQKDAVVTDKTAGFQVLLESIDPPVIFVPEGTGVIFIYPMAVGGRPRQRRLQENAFGSIQYNDVAKVGLRYRTYLTGRSPYGDPPDDRLHYLSIPDGSERLVALAEEFAGEGSKKERAMNIIRALKTKYRYSLRLASSEANALADTPLDRFLFTRRTGTCEHFATALTLMLRAVGLPSRLVTGFSGAEWNSIGEYYAVRSRFAHSWTEVFLDGEWVSQDATPPSFEEGETWRPSAFSLFIDTVRMRWHKHIVGYDASSQFEIAMGIWKFTRRHRTQRIFDWRFSWWMVIPVLGTGLIVFGIYWLKKRKQKKKTGYKKRRSLWKQQKAASSLYVRLERKLDSHGYFRPKFRTPLEHVEVLVSDGANIAQDVKYITKRYNDVRFGQDDFRSGELAELFLKIKHL